MRDLDALESSVRRAGCRITPQRDLILRALCELDGHASAERVHERVIAGQPRINLSTVYRALERLRDLGILSQIDLGRQCAEFEIVGDRPHHHLVCEECGNTLELDCDVLQPLEQELRRRYGFLVNLNHLALFGTCPDCQKPKRKAKKQTLTKRRMPC